MSLTHRPHVPHAIASAALAALACSYHAPFCEEQTVDLVSDTVMVDRTLACAYLDRVRTSQFGTFGPAVDVHCPVLCGKEVYTQCSIQDSAFTEQYRQLNTSDAGAIRCPVTPQVLSVRCSVPDTQRIGSESSCPVAGRRPLGAEARGAFATCLPAHLGIEQAYLRREAELEAASVLAFANLAEALAAHGAPAALVKRALHAEAEERQHTASVANLARLDVPACEARTPARCSAPPTLLELALDNAAEGMVRETYGAAQAQYRARAASSDAARAVFAKLAKDEAEHAALSWDLADWYAAQLSDEQNAQVRQAFASAASTLRHELRHEPEPELVRDLGLPDRNAALTIWEELRTRLWAVAGDV